MEGSDFFIGLGLLTTGLLIGMLIRNSKSLPSAENEERWELQRDADGFLTSVTVHREIAYVH